MANSILSCIAHGGTFAHGADGRPTTEYRIWGNMRNRCRNPRNPAYPDYGGRGITVCERWNSFENFLADMGKRPEGLTLERVDNERGYSPENCVWATPAAQAANRRNAVWLTWNGETLKLKEWAERTGLTVAAIRCRRRLLGWSVEKALSTPLCRPTAKRNRRKKV